MFFIILTKGRSIDICRREKLDHVELKVWDDASLKNKIIS